MFLLEGASMFAAQLLSNRLARDGVAARILPAAKYWRAAIDGIAPSDTMMLRVLKHGARRPAAWRRWLRPLRDLRERDGFVRWPIELVDFERDVVCVTLCPLTSLRVKQTNDRVVICPLYEWFYPPESADRSAGVRRGVSAPLRDHLVERLAAGFAERDARLSPVTLTYLWSWFDEATGWVRFYRERVLRRPERIPRRLWKGTNGNIWLRTLAGAVKSRGGEVTGHDHAFGANYAENTLIPFNELQVVDRFVTFTRAHAELYERTGPALLVSGKMPHIEHVGPQEGVEPLRPGAPARPAGRKAISSILYVTPYVTYDQFGAFPLMPVPVAFDWQARLFRMLQAMGYRVAQKPHPESDGPTPPAFARDFGVPALSGRFEDVYDDYDLILFDYPMQTCFGFTLRTSKPVVLIDFGVAEYKPEIRALLDKRCAVVPGRYDAQNRAHVEPAALNQAIERAPFLNDPGFAAAVLLSEPGQAPH
jgi:hypothetical protein